MTSSLQMLAYGAGADQCAEYCRMAKSTSIAVLQRFTRGIVNLIYPWWTTFLKTIRSPTRPKEIEFAKAQEEYRKNVERWFGILQSHFGIVRGAARGWDKEDLRYIMLTCIILHNMIVEDELPEDSDDELESDEEEENNMRPKISEVWEGLTGNDFDHVGRYDHYMNGFMDRYQQIRSEYTHSNIQEYLIQHFWEVKGNRSI
ncbi:uncharacterized protein LOC133744729 [Rosa rugosa]|uniref:uncharacterized protein LOC133744729 n=1 Tax=Rosa rugosa TaxID=74645 RepID=UPI002B4167E6|nr:uncharacterized protein LOC133744729 [Rosa rugosa]